MTHSLHDAYAILTGEELAAFIIIPDGQVLRYDPQMIPDGLVLNLVPGSFNPLHGAHMWLYNESMNYGHTSVFEISTRRFDKPDLSLDDLTRIVQQFNTWTTTVIITNARSFKDKIGVLQRDTLNIHIGVDNWHRFRDVDGEEAIASYAAVFFVYDRIVDEKLVTVEGSALPDNVRRGGTPPQKFMRISSSKIRNNVTNK